MSVVKQPLPFPGIGVQAAARLAVLPLRLLRTGLGRRLALVAALALAAGTVVGALYDHADPPVVPVVAAAAPVAGAGRVAQAAVAPVARPAGRAGAKAVGSPAGAAVAWYAARLGVPASRVRALQQQPAGSGRVGVLVLARTADGRVPTALVVVARTPQGWRVAG